jgi:N-acetyltransferase
MEIKPIVLTGKDVQLEPLSPDHALELAEAGSNEDIWRYMRYGPINSPEKMKSFISYLLGLQKSGTDLPFAVIHLNSGKAIGMTRYMSIEPDNRSLEIGGTWYNRDYQRTAVNTECKFLLLRHAFEELACIRVQFKADVRNERSQRALERIGAVKEGVLRDHMILPDGTVRSSVFYSILANEWPAVKQNLLKLMSR